eukprot:363683-Chlamydomonas_euryale.AAC.7
MKSRTTCGRVGPCRDVLTRPARHATPQVLQVLQKLCRSAPCKPRPVRLPQPHLAASPMGVDGAHAHAPAAAAAAAAGDDAVHASSGDALRSGSAAAAISALATAAYRPEDIPANLSLRDGAAGGAGIAAAAATPPAAAGSPPGAAKGAPRDGDSAAGRPPTGASVAVGACAVSRAAAAGSAANTQHSNGLAAGASFARVSETFSDVDCAQFEARFEQLAQRAEGPLLGPPPRSHSARESAHAPPAAEARGSSAGLLGTPRIRHDLVELCCERTSNGHLAGASAAEPTFALPEAVWELLEQQQQQMRQQHQQQQQPSPQYGPGSAGGSC